MDALPLAYYNLRRLFRHLPPWTQREGYKFVVAVIATTTKGRVTITRRIVVGSVEELCGVLSAWVDQDDKFGQRCRCIVAAKPKRRFLRCSPSALQAYWDAYWSALDAVPSQQVVASAQQPKPVEEPPQSTLVQLAKKHKPTVWSRRHWRPLPFARQLLSRMRETAARRAAMKRQPARDPLSPETVLAVSTDEIVEQIQDGSVEAQSSLLEPRTDEPADSIHQDSEFVFTSAPEDWMPSDQALYYCLVALRFCWVGGPSNPSVEQMADHIGIPTPELYAHLERLTLNLEDTVLQEAFARVPRKQHDCFGLLQYYTHVTRLDPIGIARSLTDGNVEELGRLRLAQGVQCRVKTPSYADPFWRVRAGDRRAYYRWRELHWELELSWTDIKRQLGFDQIRVGPDFPKRLLLLPKEVLSHYLKFVECTSIPKLPWKLTRAIALLAYILHNGGELKGLDRKQWAKWAGWPDDEHLQRELGAFKIGDFLQTTHEKRWWAWCSEEEGEDPAERALKRQAQQVKQGTPSK